MSSKTSAEGREWVQRASQKEIKNMIKELDNLRDSLDYHVLDPEGLPSIRGSIEFVNPVPLSNVVWMIPFNRELNVLVGVNRVWLKKLEFFNDMSYRARAVLKVSTVDNEDIEPVIAYRSSVEALTLLYHENAYRELTGGQTKIEGSELADLLQFMDGIVKAVAQSGLNKVADAREVFRKYHEATGYGEYSIFELKDWRTINFITDYVGPLNEDFVGISYKKKDPYIIFYNAVLEPVDVIGIDSIKESKYRITMATLSKSPLMPSLIKTVKEGVKYLNEYMELAKLVFLGVKAYVT